MIFDISSWIPLANPTGDGLVVPRAEPGRRYQGPGHPTVPREFQIPHVFFSGKFQCFNLAIETLIFHEMFINVW
jgi:hypothetical protein